MTSIYTSVHAGLRIRGLADFAISSVPDEYQEPLVKFLAGKAAGEFHFSGQRLQDKKLEAMEGLRELQILHEDRAIYDTATDFF